MKRRTPHINANHDLHGRPGSSEKGAALLIVLVLSAIALAVMTTLIYMLTVGAQITGLEKRYRTAHDASFGGWEITSQLLATRGSTTDAGLFKGKLDSAGLSPTINLSPPGCTGTAGDGTKKYGLEAKLMTSSKTWSPECNQDISLDRQNPNSYDISMQLGSVDKKYAAYTVYGKIANTVEGNTGNETTGSGLQATGTVNSTSGVITVVAVPYMYTIEVEAENASNPSERAKLSVLYQY